MGLRHSLNACQHPHYPVKLTISFIKSFFIRLRLFQCALPGVRPGVEVYETDELINIAWARQTLKR